MDTIIISSGIFSKGPEHDLWNKYIKRLFMKPKLIEVPEGSSKNSFTSVVMKNIKEEAFIVGLDERGKLFSTIDLSNWIEGLKLRSVKKLCFLIGPADGLSDDLRSKCDLLLSLGKMTWPHLLVRGLLAEQLYRIQQIERGHPYHREG